MRVLESKRNPKSGELYHYCPKTQDVAHLSDCCTCPNDGQRPQTEELRGSYKIHCPHGTEVKAIIPSHVDDQLPTTWDKDKFKLTEYTVLEPKKDGVRCLMKIGTVSNQFFGRNNTKFGDQSEFTECVPHLKKLVLTGLSGTIFDCELLVDGKGEDSTGTLGATMTVVGSDPPKALEAQEKYGYAHLWVFDIPTNGGVDITNQEWQIRHDLLFQLINHLPEEAKKYIHLMPCWRTHDENEKRVLYSQFLAQGYEGGVLKNPRATYYELRAQLKLIDEVTLDAVVTGYEMGTPNTKYATQIGVVKFSVCDGATSTLREIGQCIPGSDIKRAELTKLLVGKTTEEITALNIIIWAKGKNWTKEYHIRHPRIIEYCQDRIKPTTIDFTQVVRR